MEVDELRATVNLANKTVRGILQGQAVLEEVKEEIRRREINPFEENYIYEDHYGASPYEPREIEVYDGITITSQVLHRQGSNQSDIKGADLMYEIEGVKYVLIQYKRIKGGDVVVDRSQLNTLRSNCPSDCQYPYFKQKTRIDGMCGSWYCARRKDEGLYVHACEADLFSRQQATVAVEKFKERGLGQQSFQELFGKCRIGAPVSPQSMIASLYHSLYNDRVFFYVRQNKAFDWQQYA
jgi:hypothetical protein